MQCNFFKRAYKEKLENEQSDDEAVPNQVSLHIKKLIFIHMVASFPREKLSKKCCFNKLYSVLKDVKKQGNEQIHKCCRTTINRFCIFKKMIEGLRITEYLFENLA
jgi:hypothetical protein